MSGKGIYACSTNDILGFFQSTDNGEVRRADVG